MVPHFVVKVLAQHHQFQEHVTLAEDQDVAQLHIQIVVQYMGQDLLQEAATDMQLHVMHIILLRQHIVIPLQIVQHIML